MIGDSKLFKHFHFFFFFITLHATLRFANEGILILFAQFIYFILYDIEIETAMTIMKFFCYFY